MTQDPIADAQARVLSLFHGPLAEVRFPDVDRAMLDADADAVRAARERLLDAEASVSAAKDALEVAQRRLRERAHRGLSYARIYAETHPDVLEALGETPATSAETPARRKRTRKTPEGTAELPALAAE